MSNWIKLLWLSFFTAVLAEIAFFAILDPQQLYLFGEPVGWSPMVIYSLGFFMFWGLTALTAFLVALLQKPGEVVNRETEIKVHPAPDGQQLRSN